MTRLQSTNSLWH
jgi:hypothetical protein